MTKEQPVNPDHKKTTSDVENLRKPLSRLLALGILLVALLTVPKQFDSMAGEVMEILGFCFLMAAALGRVWCAIYISGRKDKTLCLDGPYFLSRNPLYFFSFLGVLGFGCALQSGFLIVLSTLGYLLLYRYIIRSEESRLLQIFGEPYCEYMASTPRFFPKFTKLDSPSSYVVNPRIIEKSMREVVWFLAIIIFIEALEIIHAHGILVLWHLPF